MEPETFDVQLKQLELWHKKELSADQSDLYLRLLSNVKDAAMPSIVRKWIRSSRPMPGSFPTVDQLLEQYRIWVAQNPQPPEPHPECPDCQSKGWLWVRVFDEKLQYHQTMIFGCGSCHGYKSDIGTSRRVTVSSRFILENKGLDVWPFNDI